MFVHVVLFWCKPGTPETVKQAIVDYAHKQMPTIPSVRHVWAGRSVASARDVVDSSYDLGLCVIFDNQAGHDVYQPHDIHQNFIKLFSSHWAKVRVFDYK